LRCQVDPRRDKKVRFSDRDDVKVISSTKDLKVEAKIANKQGYKDNNNTDKGKDSQ
jgi:hypothetical protein